MMLEIVVPSMACSACADTITKAVTALDPTATVEADLKTKQVKIETLKPAAEITAAIETAGYPVS